ncbi:MAG: Mrp/NBP35 family ATP-binding protein [Alphaproteobacteria bacterium]|nr:Mrp/NBP35 family ATP-binding protein [Alphaproteobacteria bacterium]
MDKLIMVMNGKGGVGKDSVCAVLAKHFKTQNDSSVDPFREITRAWGWDGKTRDNKWRKLMVDLKQLAIDYSDFPANYIMGKIREFMASDKQVFFTHIREAAEIEKFISRAKAEFGDRARVRSVLVRRGAIEGKVFGNAADDNVNEYAYDWIYDNDGTLENLDADFMKAFSEWK